MNSLTLILILSAVMLVWFSAGSFINRRMTEKTFREIRSQLKGHVSRIEFRSVGSGFIIKAVKPPRPFKELTITLTLLPRETLFALFSWISGKRDLVNVSGEVERRINELDILSADSPFRAEGQKIGSAILLRGKPHKKLLEIMELGAWRITLEGGRVYMLMPLRALEKGALRSFLDFLRR